MIGLISMSLTIVNILSIYVAGVWLFIFKEVAPVRTSERLLRCCVVSPGRGFGVVPVVVAHFFGLVEISLLLLRYSSIVT